MTKDTYRTGSGGFKLNDYMGAWIAEYTVLINAEAKEDQSGRAFALEVSDGLFYSLGFTKKYHEMLSFTKNFKAVEFKGDNIVDDFSKFFESEKNIEAQVNVIAVMLEEFNYVMESVINNKELEIFKARKEQYYKAGRESSYIISMAYGCSVSVRKLLELLKELQGLSNTSQYNILNLYFTHKDIMNHLLDKKVEKNNIDVTDKNFNRISNFNTNAILTIFSRASNYDIEKELYYDRRDNVKRVTNSIQQENKDENSLDKKLQNKEFNNNYSINYKIVYLENLPGSNPLLLKATSLIDIVTKDTLKRLKNLLPQIAITRNDVEVKSSMDKLMAAGYNRIVIVESDKLELIKPENRPRLYAHTLLTAQRNKKEGKDLVEGTFELLGENIEYLKYVNP
jgi:hypothetical protein